MMRTLIVITGVRGSGKSTLVESIRGIPGVVILQPSTTRPAREGELDEYEFVQDWQSETKAWSIEVGSYTYGMRRTELDRVTSDVVGITVFDPGNLSVYDAKAKSLAGFEAVLVGLDTVSDVGCQAVRVGNDANRLIPEAHLRDQREAIKLKADIVLSGDAATIRRAFLSVVDLLGSRGGVLHDQAIRNLIAAGALLSNAEESQIQPASYDLRLSGKKIWCRGKYITLDDLNPVARIPPYSYITVEALEEANLPRFIVGRFDLKVSLFFSGIILSNGPQVDPGYRGSLFCMLFNGSDVEVGLNRDKHFATIEFCTTARVTSGYNSQYSGKTGFEQFLTSQSSISPGGNLLQRIDDGDERVKNEIEHKLQGVDRWAMILVGVISVVVIALLMFAYSSYTELTKAVTEANKAIAEANVAKKEFERSVLEIKSSLGELDKTKAMLEAAIEEASKNVANARTGGGSNRKQPAGRAN